METITCHGHVFKVATCPVCNARMYPKRLLRDHIKQHKLLALEYRMTLTDLQTTFKQMKAA